MVHVGVEEEGSTRVVRKRWALELRDNKEGWSVIVSNTSDFNTSDAILI